MADLAQRVGTTSADADPVVTELAPARPSRADRNRFLLVAGGATLLATLVVVVVALVRDDGHLVYALDDAGIHLSIARQLAHHFTWGVTDGVYVSASSSPAWTLLLAAATLVTPTSPDFWPLVLNVVAAGWILWVFAANQTVIRPRGRSVPGWIAAVVLPVVVLFLPAMAMVGMEHLLHAALVLQLLVLVWRLEDRVITVRSAAPLVAIALVAGAVRIETLFVVAGVVVGLGLRLVPSLATPATALQWSRRSVAVLAAALVAAAALPFSAYGLVNRAFGLGFLPTSIEAKRAIGGRGLIRPVDRAIGALFGDPVLTVLVAAVLVYLVFALFGGPRRTLVLAVAFLVAAAAHAFYSDMGFYERYQTYLVITGTFVLLLALGEVALPRWRDAAVTAVALALVLAAAPVKIPLTWDAPLASSNTYRQRYQLGRFLAEAFPGETVATGELGYVTYLHDGGVVDLLGLGSADVEQRLEQHRRLSTADVAELVDAGDVAAIGVYPATVALTVPDSWYLAGEWHLRERSASAFGRTLQFYAPDEAKGRRLAAALDAFAPQLPSGVRYVDRDALVRRFLANGNG